eukprot:6411163-Amphidinium_carterae.1
MSSTGGILHRVLYVAILAMPSSDNSSGIPSYTEGTPGTVRAANCIKYLWSNPAATLGRECTYQPSTTYN